ncbi:MAG: DEAD/DEAH box helicase [Rhodospirillaceae bacterium]
MATPLTPDYAPDRIFRQVASLHPTDRLVVRLKAFIGVATNKGEFLAVMNATGIRAPDGRPWSAQIVNPALDRLKSLGLLDEVYACPIELWHPLALEVFTAPEVQTLLDAVLRSFPESNRYAYYQYTLQSDWAVLRRLRLAIYANDNVAYHDLLTAYDNEFNRARGAHILDVLFLATVLDLGWLTSRSMDIQYGLFATKLDHFMTTGQAPTDLAVLVAHYRAREDEPGYEGFKWLLLHSDVLAGRVAAARRKCETLTNNDETYTESNRLLLQGTLDFLEGRNDEALNHYRQALKLYKKESGKRKIFFNGSNGIFFLLALIRANDPAFFTEIQANLDGVNHDGNMFSPGFSAIQALLWLLQGREPKTRELLAILRLNSVNEPLSAACLALVEFLTDSALAAVYIKDTTARFEALKEVLPLIARIHAEVLERISNKPDPFTEFLRQTSPDTAPLIEFTGIVELRQPWERTLDNLAAFLKTGSARPVTAPTTGKSKRLVWFVEPESGYIEVVEQTPKGRDGWTPGRTVAMKRLHEQDPRLDYLTDHDRRVLRTIRKDTSSWYNEESYSFDAYRTPLALIEHPLVFDARRRDRPLELVAYPVELVVTENRGHYKFTLSHRAPGPTVFMEAETPTRLRVVDFSAKTLAVQEILGEGGLTVPRQGRERVLALLKDQHPSLPIRADIAEADQPAIEGQPGPVLQIAPLDEGLKIAMVVRPFGPSGPYYLAGQGGQSVLAVIDGVRQRCNRDLDAERRAAAATLAALPTLHREAATGHEWIIGDTESALEFLLETRACLPPPVIEWPEGRRLAVHPEVSAGSLALKVGGARDWFQINGEVRIDEELVLDMQDLLKRLDKAKGRFIPLADGSFITLTRKFQKQLERLGGVAEDQAKGLRLATLGAVAIQDLVEDAGTVKADKEWKAFVTRLSAAGQHRPVVPSTLQAELRDYQVEGFQWLSRLAYWQAGACLADDMGLGKTVQAIAAMLEQAPLGPCLVIAPTSVCHNWEHELERFAPTLTVQRLGATGSRAEHISGLKPMDVLVTSYGLLHQEADHLAEIDWQMAVFDEAQAIKNAETRRARAGQRIKARFRLALTGTPIENYLEELWSLFNIINPGLLGSRESFSRRFGTPIERNRSDSALHALRALIRPFILRRTKSTVLAELPPRTELTLEIALPEEERAFYEAVRRRALEAIAQLREGGTGGQTRIHILAEITRLRRACCHPGLVDAETELPGAKLEAFLELVEELVRNRHKALVFSQFVGQLERVREALVARGITHQYLDGGTPAKDREKRVTAFQAGEGDLFLISLKAGGTGLNLTAADYVIHLDPWWNPAVEDQASDRAHRIGQQRPVTVYRLIVRDSIEERILDLHRAKRDLATDLLEGSEISARLTDDDLLDLIRT